MQQCHVCHDRSVDLDFSRRKARTVVDSDVCMMGTVVVLCVCVSVTMLAATYMYLLHKFQVRCYKVPCGLSSICIVRVLLKTLITDHNMISDEPVKL